MPFGSAYRKHSKLEDEATQHIWHASGRSCSNILPHYIIYLDAMHRSLFTYDPLLRVRIGSSSLCATTPLHWSLYFYGGGSAASRKFRMSILSVELCQGSIAVSSAALRHRINPFDCLAASSLPMRPLSPFWSPHLLSASNSKLPPCEIVSFPLWKSLTMETFMPKTRHLRRKKSNWLSSIQTARTNTRTR